MKELKTIYKNKKIVCYWYVLQRWQELQLLTVRLVISSLRMTLQKTQY